ncbi:hypothetical protein H4S08_003745 [Coemansia sp. RSA 1365]|nr:hypothetical protein H4S08_003745 [Coemansia sp. RSA 1365]
MRISDVFGRLATFWFGIVLFVIFTGVSGNASSAYTFAVLRAFQGVGAGIMTSVSVTVVGTYTSERSRALYVSGLAAAQLFGIGAAHIIGGKLAIDDNFRWGVYMAAPLSAVPAILCTPALIVEKKHLRPSESFIKRVLHFDYIGSLLLLGTSIMLTSGTTFGGNEHAWDSATVICLLVFGTVSTVLFMVWETYGAKHPIFNSRWLKERNLQISMIGVLFISMAFFANAVYVPILYITVRTQTTDIAGRMTAPYWGTSICAAILIVGLTLRWKPTLARPMVWIGLLIATVFSGAYYTIEVEPSSLTKERALYALAGLGIGLAYPSIIYLAQISVPRDESGAAAAVAHFLSIVGGMLGMILYQACLKSRLIHNLVPIFEESTFLSTFNVHTMDIAGLEMSGGTMLHYEPKLAVTIGEKMMDSLHTTYILSVPLLGTAFILSLLYKRHFE